MAISAPSQQSHIASEEQYFQIREARALDTNAIATLTAIAWSSHPAIDFVAPRRKRSPWFWKHLHLVLAKLSSSSSNPSRRLVIKSISSDNASEERVVGYVQFVRKNAPEVGRGGMAESGVNPPGTIPGQKHIPGDPSSSKDDAQAEAALDGWSKPPEGIEAFLNTLNLIISLPTILISLLLLTNLKNLTTYISTINRTRPPILTASTGPPQIFTFDLAVDPAYRGRGLAKKLMDWGKRKAQAENLPILLVASEKIVERMYEKWGWKVEERYGLEFGGWKAPVMVWEPDGVDIDVGS